MPAFTFKTGGTDKATHRARNIQESFDAADDGAAVAHAATVLAPQANAELFGCDNAEVLRADQTPVGVLDMRRLTWQMGEVPQDERPVYMGYTRNQLKPALDLIKNREHWKYPFDAVVPRDADRNLISAAAAFFCGSTVEFEEVEGGLRVAGPGYYLSMGS